ncbi:MAG: bifunctional precorrin-2 dehydrogenase/sirohydrochlorin ferrochelatase [Thermodesulfobacteriota bacterium]
MRYYPVFLDISGKPCAVVGGGAVAERKARGLLAAGARVTVISPVLTVGLERLAEKGEVGHVGRALRPGDLKGASLVVGASSSKAANMAAFEEAQRLGIPANTADDPGLCTFIVPSVIERGGLTVAISTSAKAPALARRLREELEGVIGPEYETVVEVMGAARKHLLKTPMGRVRKEKIMKALAASNLPALAASGDRAGINGLLTGLLGPGVTLSKLGVRLTGARKTGGKGTKATK